MQPVTKATEDAMPSTPRTLLDRLRRPVESPTIAADWASFVELFTPLLFAWARRVTPGEADAADLVQDVFVKLVRKLPEYQHDGRHRFRDWLHTLLVNCRRDHLRRRTAVPIGDLAELPAVADPIEEIAEAEYRGYLIRRAVQVVERDFEPATWQAFQTTVLQGRPAADAAALTGLSVAAIYAAVARVRRRLRQELHEFLE
jgi:RNA polymerase sigma-70 factor (ECF subfamily)